MAFKARIRGSTDLFEATNEVGSNVDAEALQIGKLYFGRRYAGAFLSDDSTVFECTDVRNSVKIPADDLEQMAIPVTIMPSYKLRH